MKRFTLAAYKFRMPNDKGGKATEPTKLKATDMPQTTVKALHVDDAMRKARKLFEGNGFQIRSISTSPGNVISIVVIK